MGQHEYASTWSGQLASDFLIDAVSVMAMQGLTAGKECMTG